MKKLLSVVLVVLIVGVVQMTVIAGDGAQTEVSWRKIASWELDVNGNVIENGLTLFKPEVDEAGIAADSGFIDCTWIVEEVGGLPSVVTTSTYSEHYLMANVHDDVLFEAEIGTTVKVVIEYFDGFGGLVFIQYDSHANMWDDRAWGQVIQKGASFEWKTCECILNDVRFANREKDVADFRIAGGTPPLEIRKIELYILDE